MDTEQVTCCHEIKLDCSDNINKDMDCLHKKFSSLITNIREFYAQSNISAIKIAHWVEEFNDGIKAIACHDVDIDKIFQSMKPHYNFLEIDLIRSLVEAYPLNDEPPLHLESRFSRYVMSHDNFVKHVDIDGSIMACIKVALKEQGDSKTEPEVILKLSGRWGKRNVENLKKLSKFLFLEDAKYLTIKNTTHGCVMIKFLVSSKNYLQSLTCKIQAKIHLLRHIGIFKVIIDKRAIVDKDENPDFSFEASLLNAIESIDTALLYASESRHIEIFKELASN